MCVCMRVCVYACAHVTYIQTLHSHMHTCYIYIHTYMWRGVVSSSLLTAAFAPCRNSNSTYGPAVYIHTHTYTHTHIHTYTHIHTHTHTYNKHTYIHVITSQLNCLQDRNWYCYYHAYTRIHYIHSTQYNIHTCTHTYI